MDAECVATIRPDDPGCGCAAGAGDAPEVLLTLLLLGLLGGGRRRGREVNP